MVQMYLSVLNAILMFWIASRYFLIPNGPLKRVRIVYFSTIGVYAIVIGFIQHYVSVEIYQRIALIFDIIVMGILFYFGHLLEKQLQKIRYYSQYQETLFDFLRIRLSTELGILWISPKYCQSFFGRESSELIGKSIGILIHKDSDEAYRQLQDYVKSEQTGPFSLKVQLIDRRQTPRWFQMAVTKELSDGQLVTLNVGLQEISNEVYQQEFLELLKHTLDAATVGITVVDDDTKTILYVNHYESDMHGYEDHELIGKDARMLAPDIMQGITIRDGATQESYVSLNKHKNGNIFPVRLNKASIEYGHGHSARNARVMFCYRVNELTLYEAMTLGDRTLLMLIMSKSGGIYWMNDLFQELLGYLDKQALPENLNTLCNIEDFDRLFDIIEDTSRHEIPQIYRVYGNDGHHHKVLLAVFLGVSHVFLIGRAV